MSGITTAQSGFPMSIGPGGNAATVFGGNQHADLTGQPFKTGNCGGTNGVPEIPVGTKYCFFNPAAFTAPADFTFGNAPRYFSNLRAPGYVNQDLTLGKVVQPHGKTALAIRPSRCSMLSTIRISAYPMPASEAPTWA